jgi:murein DD-endopeptidase MepM/ murein hydrolase activator NlpD
MPDKLKLVRPVPKQFRISSPFGWRQDPLKKDQGQYHNGIDFAVPIGTQIVAMASGVVVRAGWENDLNEKQGFGRRVIQSCNINGVHYYITYGHLSEIWVHEGQDVTAGTSIGLTGNTGRSTGPHTHVQAREKDSSVCRDIEFFEEPEVA